MPEIHNSCNPGETKIAKYSILENLIILMPKSTKAKNPKKPRFSISRMPKLRKTKTNLLTKQFQIILGHAYLTYVALNKEKCESD